MYSFLGRAPEGPDGGVGAKHKNKTIFSSSFSFCHQFSFLPSCEMFLFACVLSERRGMCPVAPMMPTQEHIIYNLLVIFLSLLMSLFLYSQIRLWFWHFSFFPLLSLSLSSSRFPIPTSLMICFCLSLPHEYFKRFPFVLRNSLEW